MNRRNVGLWGLGTFAVVCALGMMAPLPASSSENDAPPSQRTEAEQAAGYVGTKKCKMCHVEWYDAMMETAKAASWEALEAGKRREDKQRVGLDPAKDYTTDATCLKCHSVGFGEPGGYEVPKPGDRRAARRVERFQGVGCESCHGPGEQFVEVMQEVLRSERPYDQRELRDAGLRAVGAEVCHACHTGDAPCHDEKLKGDPLSLAERGFHHHVPLKYRKSTVSTEPKKD